METENNNPHKNKVHHILAHSYSVYFILFLASVYLDFIFKVKIFTKPFAVPLGFSLLVFSTILILWAQKTSRNLDVQNLSKESFYKGPYRFTRGPTHLGLFLLLLGFGVMADAVFVVLFTFIAFLISKFVFLRKQEMILAEKYGAPYLEYKKAVKF